MSAIIEKKGGESMRCVILSGYFEGNLSAVYHPEPADFLLAADRGLELARKSHLSPDYFIGDCDSLSAPFEGSGRILPTCKDDTDTVAALKEGLARGYREFLILGALGGRLDQTVATVQTLLFAHSCGARARVADGRNEAFLAPPGKTSLPFREGASLSLFSLAPRTEGITLTGAEYPLQNACLTGDFPLGVSNRVVEKTAELTVGCGMLLVVRSVL